jgi:hypothetical protein
MKLFAAIRMPEKFGFHPAFIGDFDLPSKKASNHPVGCAGNGFSVSGLRNGQLPLFCKVERILAAELSFVQITSTFVQHSKTESYKVSNHVLQP